jgi:hypothetical protein
VTARPTDDELERIGHEASAEIRDLQGKTAGSSAERRALYEAGIRWVLKDLEAEARLWDPRDAPRDLEDWIAEVRRDLKS